ncbi:MAG TPA: ABC transporter permease [Candidatus Woesebacteria bacterium]|nr:ABC transporter permease [Candidatus Woesebacteria bacterium]HNS65392.1 ABC transporter permease [Candidatus Woesebacteria bacterium]
MHNLNAIFTIAFRDIIKLLRDRSRILASLIFPIIFIGVLGTSLQQNLGNNLTYNFLTFVFIGVLAQTLFQSTASGIISLVEDRQTDFAQEMFIAPISRYSILIGKILGETLVALVQIIGVILFAFVINIPLDLVSLLRMAPFFLVAAFFGGAFGVMVMAGLSEQRAANQIFPFLLFPQFFLAGVFNPIQHLPLPIFIASRISPMTYAVDLLRSIYYFGKPEYADVVLFNPLIDLTVVIGFGLLFVCIGTFLFVRNERNR